MKKIIIFFFLFSMKGCTNQADIIITQPVDSTSSSEIIVEIKGAVKFPGLYTTQKGVMLYEVLHLAGGLLSDADQEQINLVQTFNSSSSINIPYKNNNNKISILINLNKATIEELMTLNGIGEAKARAIIEYRQITPFSSVEDIKKVSGIGEEVFSKIKDDITV